MTKDLTVQVQTLPDMKTEIHRLKYQVQLVQQAMKEVMVSDVHYGIIPGTKKPTLYKSGAEKLCLLFRLRPSFKCEERDLGAGHKQYTFECQLHDAKGGYIGQGVGSCSTLEAKYRWRRGEGVNTGKSLPNGYWDLKKTNAPKAQAMLGGKGFFPKKDENGAWMIFKDGGDKMENPDIADVYNTCYKIAKKRCFVDATLTCTGASDCFDQDLDDAFEEGEYVPDVEEVKQPQVFVYDLTKLPEDKIEVARKLALMSGATEEGENLFRSTKRIAKLDNARIEVQA